ncbi:MULTISPECIES: tetratricopeptide repeat protein [unclassified Nocardiopsis]|uniref:tetratricopeptide repeat protein n=1 Tax=unclassified Nocardiopsis TaxID=2649073 RepID=UPI00191529B2|nr:MULTISPECIES: tetratricopeptide repeat protein [unclassified Nocardiopsis]
MSDYQSRNLYDFQDTQATTIIGQQVNTHVRPLQTPPTWPLLVGQIPAVARHYQQRTITAKLHYALATQPSVALRQSAHGTNAGSVVSGMGGVGKTQLAAAYANQVLAHSRTRTNRPPREEPDQSTGSNPGIEADDPGSRPDQTLAADLVMWVNASNRTNITDAYAREAPSILQRAFDTPEEAAHAFLNWLATTDKRWLIVFDDLVLLQPPHPDGTPVTLEDLWPPSTGNGRLLITTRDSGHELTELTHAVLDLGVYTPQEADSFLTAALPKTRTDHAPEERADLAELLGRLPLALGLAVAYIANRPGMTIADYTDLFATQSQTLERMFPHQATGYARTIATTWALSIDHANQQIPRGLARPLAAMISLLDAVPIPLAVLTAPPTRAYLASEAAGECPTAVSSTETARDDSNLPPPSPGPAAPGTEECKRTVPEQDVHDALALLNRLNLITLTGNSSRAWSTVNMHQLVQRATREHTTTRPTRDRVRATAGALIHAWPEVERDTELGERLRAHTRALRSRTIAGRSVEGWMWQPNSHPLLFRAGSSLGEAGRARDAVEYWENMVRATEHHLGPDHPDTLTTRANLAHWQGRAGDPASATTAYHELLTDRLRVLGPDHPDTLTTRANLAHWQGRAGDPAGAATAYHELLTEIVRVLGPDHPDTLTTRANLAHWQGRAGDPAGAATAFNTLLTEMLRVLGPDHPDTLTTRANLAHWQGEAGNPAGAATAYHELLTDRLRVLGPDHPDTLTTRANLASWQGEAGNPAGAATAYRDLLTDRLRVLGPDHPDTLTTQGNLARWQGEAGDPAGAATAFNTLLTEMLRLLGPDHPNTLTTRNNLAHWQGKAGDPAGAATIYHELLTEIVRVLGPDHPNTLTTRNNLAHWQGKAGDPAGAATAYRDLLTDRLRVLGPDHPNTLTTRNNLAHWLAEVGPYEEALSSYDSAIDQFSVTPQWGHFLRLSKARFCLTHGDEETGIGELISLTSVKTQTSASVQARHLLRGPLRPATEKALGDQDPLWMQITDEVQATVRDWLGAPTWSDSQRYLKHHKETLFASLVRECLRELATTVSQAALHLQILNRAQKSGIDNAYVPLVLDEHLTKWRRAPDWEKSEQYLTAHADLLLRQESLTALRAQDKGPSAESVEIFTHSAILTISRSRSVKEAYRLVRDVEFVQKQAEAAMREGDTAYLHATAVLTGAAHHDVMAMLLYLALFHTFAEATEENEQILEELRAAAHGVDVAAREHAISLVTEAITVRPAKAPQLVKLLTALSNPEPR